MSCQRSFTHDRLFAALALGLAAVAFAPPGAAGNGGLGDTFTYQGQLRESGQPATGLYDFQICLYDSPTDPVQLACLVPSAEDIPVEDGLFALDLNFGPGRFVGQARYLELRVRPGDSSDGFTQLLPRQQLRATPEAMYAQTTPWMGLSDVPAGFSDGVDNEGVSQISAGFGLSGGTITTIGSLSVNPATVQSRVGSSCSVGSAIRAIGQDGTVTCQAAPLAWLLGGNAGANPSSQYLGTSDNQPLILRANAQRVARFQTVALTGPSGGFTANVSMGSPNNAINFNVRGGTISGGGVSSGDSDPDFVSENVNQVFGHYGVIAGGYAQVAGDSSAGPVASAFATVGGGLANHARGAYSVVPGGAYNWAVEDYSSVLGGFNSSASGVRATVVGGAQNAATGADSVTLGGSQLCAGGAYSHAAGRRAKVRPGLNSGAAGLGCAGIEVVGADGDAGTFAWADSQTGNFVSTGINQFLIRAAGGVGIGTNAPQNQLHVVESIDAVGFAENHVVQFENPSTGASPDVLALKVGTTNPGAGVNFISFLHGGATSLGSIEGNGSGGVSFMGPGNDFAEYLPKLDLAESIHPGDVLGLHAGRLSRQTEGADLILVASSSPIIAGNDPGQERRGDYVLAALLGQVQLAVRGPVAAGDLLLPSGQGDGVARAVSPSTFLDATERSHVFARVLGIESNDGNQSMTVRALVGQGGQAIASNQALSRLEQENAQLRIELALMRSEQQQAIAALRHAAAELQQRTAQTHRTGLQP